MKHGIKMVSALVLGLLLFAASEGMALAYSSPDPQRSQARLALQCPGAVSARTAHRHYFTLSEARKCAPGASVTALGGFAVQITASTEMIGFSLTHIVPVGANQYRIETLSVTDESAGSRTVQAGGCPETSTWNEGGWVADMYTNNQTRWQRYWPYCGSSSPQAHVLYVSPSCVAFWPFVCNSTQKGVYNDNGRDVYTYVTNIFSSFTGGGTQNAWEEMIWSSRGWWNFYAWMNT